MLLPFITVRLSHKRGKGVFTQRSIPANTIIEIAPVIVLSESDRKTMERTKLYHYIFEWGKRKKQGCLALGYVSMYNHSRESNCAYEMDYDAQSITIRTVRKVAKNEELFFNYNGVWNDKTPVMNDEI